MLIVILFIVMAITQHYFSKLKGLARDKHSSLFKRSISAEEKKVL
jgi:hypothetical protein